MCGLLRRGLPVWILVVFMFQQPAPGDAPSRDDSPEALASHSGWTFEVAVPPAGTGSHSGRVFVVLSRRARPEPRLALGSTEPDAPLALARDVTDLGPGRPAVLDARAVCYPASGLSKLESGTYHVQAVFDTSRDVRAPNAPGNAFSAVQAVTIDPARDGRVRLELTDRVPPESLPADTDRLKYIEVRSRLLSEFHGRPITIKAGIILPRDFDREPERRYPLRVHIGGFGSRYTSVGRMMAPSASFRASWDADDAPRLVLLHLDGAGPLGDPYQVNSANHGPYGDAVTQELIPEVERRFRCLGTGQSRLLDGGSTGGWVALALQVFYPDLFQGAWSFCPDPVDFRSYERVNIYDDENAYTAPGRGERPAARDPQSGRVRLTMRHECGMENLLGQGDRYTHSGQQWGSWNAVFSPKGADGRPVPLWDPWTGQIDHRVAAQWANYDLRRVLEADWARLGPRLRGKLHIWVGEADDYYLDEAVRRLEEFLTRAVPRYEGTITYGPGQGHCWMGLPEPEMLRQMARAVGD